MPDRHRDAAATASLRRALRLYAITPEPLPPIDILTARIAAAARGGVTAVQLRDKRPLAPAARLEVALAVRDACRAAGTLFIVNDDIELALEVGAGGVHVGPNDAPVADVVARAAGRLVVGASAGDVNRAFAAVAAGAAYLGVGAIFDARHSKPDASAARGVDVLRRMRAEPALRDVPIVAIGGIEPATAGGCIEAGADGVAAIRALLGAPDCEAAARAFLEA